MIATDLSADARRCADLLAATPRGETVSFATVTATIGRDINRCRHVLHTALRVAERETGACFASVRGVGYRRLAPEEIVKVGQTARARIRGYARRGRRTIQAGLAGANDLTPETQRQTAAELSSLGLLEHIARDRSLPAISETDVRPLTVADTAKAFMEKIGAVS